MKTKNSKINRVNIITLGCSKNIFDSEVLMGQLNANHIDVQHEPDEFNNSVVIINTCGFIESAKQQSIDTILQFAEAKKEGKINQLIVTGCLSERYKTELQKEIPEVDAFFGTNELPRLLAALNVNYKKELVGERILTTPKHYSYLKISEGCNRPCSFCAIPLIRGKHISTPIEQLVAETQLLAKNGVKELILIAQDISYYGIDIYGKRKLADLLNYLSDVEGIEWIRLHYAFPSGFPIEILDVINTRENVCKYLDIPLQHISNRILTSMRRGITKEGTTQLIGKIRQKVPEIALRTTLMTGYPNETEEDFQELLQWVKETRFDRLGVFTYSHEEDTSAYFLEDNIASKIKQQRADKVMRIQNDISLQLNRQRIGKTMKVLIDKIEGDCFVGRTEFDSPEVDNEVLISTENSKLQIGEFAYIKIIAAEKFDLIGEEV